MNLQAEVMMFTSSFPRPWLPRTPDLKKMLHGVFFLLLPFFLLQNVSFCQLMLLSIFIFISLASSPHPLPPPPSPPLSDGVVV